MRRPASFADHVDHGGSIMAASKVVASHQQARAKTPSLLMPLIAVSVAVPPRNTA
jgi:hypothetical protein